MKLLRRTAWCLLLFLFVSALGADWLAPFGYDDQLRQTINAPCSLHHLLGTDALGRDRLSRVLYGGRVSLVLAPAAALLSTVMAALVGVLAAVPSPIVSSMVLLFADLVLSLPWLFLLLTVRAILPLDTTPWQSVTVTFFLLGLLGWAGPARVLRTSLVALRQAEFLRVAAAMGIGGSRRLRQHLLPHLWPLLRAQFQLLVPLFILSEAGLSLLGLGVSEPLPSWGSLLREMEPAGAIARQPAVLAPLFLLVLVVLCLQIAAPAKRDPS